jgi:lipid-binding SYLF domain-containing protein
LAAYFYLNEGFRAAPTGGQRDPGQAQSNAQRDETVPGGGEIGRLQAQMLELRRQKDDAETRLRELQTQFRVLEKDQKELKAAKARIVEFETAMALKDKDLSATDQKFKEAEKAFAQEKSAKDRMVGEFSSKEAAIEVVWAQTGKEINASVNACLDRFYRQVPGAKEFTGKASGVLVMPSVAEGGFIVGGEYGKGALRVEKRTVSYYNLASGSVGFQIGGEAKDIVMLFMTNAALKQFQASKGWEVGVDANVALVKIGGGERVDFTKMQDPIIGFVFDVKGFMADISFKGAKFTKITPK